MEPSNKIVSEKVKKTPMSDNRDTPHPTIYADQLSGFGVGPFTSKFTLAIEDLGLNARVPVVTIVMPTGMLHSLAKEILRGISGTENQKAMADLLSKYQDQIKEK